MATYQEQIARGQREKEAKEKADAEEKTKQLSPEQVRNWRLVLVHMGVPFAMSMPETMVQQFRDALQDRINVEYPRPTGDEESK